MKDSNEPTIIIGGGFVGLFVALHLSQLNYPHPIILIDCKERFVFKPLLYDYLAEQIDDSQANPRYEQLLQGSGVEFIQDRVQKINIESKQVELDHNGSISYKYLVIALGSKTGYFGVEGAQEHTLPFWTRQDASALKIHLQECLRRSLATNNPQERQKLLTVAIVGAGPTGVELTTTLADVLPQWSIKLGGNFEQIRLILINRSSQILSHASQRLRQAAETALQQRPIAVELQMNASVSAVRLHQVEFQKNNQQHTLQAATVVWTTGSTINPVVESLPISNDYRDQRGRLKVLSSLQLIAHPEIFVGGDCGVNWHQSLPPTAQVAYQQGQAIAQNLLTLAANKTPDMAKVQIRGTMLKLGLEEAAADIFERLLVSGKPAHLLRQGRYLTNLPTPVHNFKATTQWLCEEVLDNF